MAELIIEQRVPTTAEKCQLAINILSAVMAVVPQFMDDLRMSLPYHYYGALSAAVTLINIGLNYYQMPKTGKVLGVKPSGPAQ